MTYSIKNWDEIFEISESRRHKKNKWLPLPNKMDGLSYRRLTKHTQSHEIFTCWILLIQLASKMPTRGILADESGPLDFNDMELMTGFPADSFKIAIEFLISPKIGWIEHNGQTQMEIRERSERTTTTVHNSTLHNNTEQNSIYARFFPLFWENYPKRNGKKVGRKATLDLFKKIPIKELERVVRNAKNYGVDNNFAKDPERFLKKDFWMDWDEPPKKELTFDEKVEARFGD